jgi:hypothetical protein
MGNVGDHLFGRAFLLLTALLLLIRDIPVGGLRGRKASL